MGVVVLVSLLGICAILLWAVPALIAHLDDHRSKWTISVIGLVFGVTGIGWCAALTWVAYGSGERTSPRGAWATALIFAGGHILAVVGGIATGALTVIASGGPTNTKSSVLFDMIFGPLAGLTAFVAGLGGVWIASALVAAFTVVGRQ